MPETTDTATAGLAFESKTYTKKSTLPCKDVCTSVTIDIAEAGGAGVASDSINKSVFNVVRSIVHFGEQPANAKTYQEVMDSFVGAYDELKKKFPDDAMAWEAKVKSTVDYRSDNILNVKINHYTFTGGAHGYGGERSLIFNPETGKRLTRNDIFKDIKAFTAFAETKFRQKYKIPAGKSINSTGLMFVEDRYKLPDEIFFRENGILLFYNTLEVANNAEGSKDVLIPYAEAKPFLKIQP
ncbi:hypothetical protein AM493_14050 [Flavobacterium akiainvivens]|uniref:Uncharacterized protein n=1 Tax=Flavobacterium akiainvivens TaxID=1202724 RepID=A0A0M9VK25_9FLAO|nr:hypothetical protein AM493_14050 [Flavobacterium akiainvivens]